MADGILVFEYLVGGFLCGVKRGDGVGGGGEGGWSWGEGGGEAGVYL